MLKPLIPGAIGGAATAVFGGMAASIGDSSEPTGDNRMSPWGARKKVLSILPAMRSPLRRTKTRLVASATRPIGVAPMAAMDELSRSFAGDTSLASTMVQLAWSTGALIAIRYIHCYRGCPRRNPLNFNPRIDVRGTGIALIEKSLLHISVTLTIPYSRRIPLR